MQKNKAARATPRFFRRQTNSMVPELAANKGLWLAVPQAESAGTVVEERGCGPAMEKRRRS